MTELKRFSFKDQNVLRRFSMLALVAVFLVLVGRFYMPGKGMTALIQFGGNFADRVIPEIKRLPYHADEGSYGYDAQWYVQIAVRPDPRDPVLLSAVDSLSYRARRILFCWTAYVFGFGKPAWIVQVYAIQNVVCWIALGWLMLRWFSPNSWNSVFRWAAVLLSGGLCASVRYSLVDGPSLLLLACSVALMEKGSRWGAALLLGVSGLGKETNILGAGVIADLYNNRTLKDWAAMALRGVLTIAPLLLWAYYIFRIYGSESSGSAAGSRAFDGPFIGLWGKFRLIAGDIFKGGREGELARGSLYALVAASTQFVFLVCRPCLRQPWWRVGIGYCVLMIFLGDAVWEGYPGAVTRVLLPMTLAFNVLVPRGRAWILVLILGNLTVLTSWDLSRPPGGDGYKLVGASDLTQQPREAPVLRIKFSPEWYPAEGGHFEYWRWCQGPAEVSIYNSLSEPISLEVHFDVNAAAPRTVSFGRENEEYWSGEVTREKSPVRLAKLRIMPGENRFWWHTDREADQPRNPSDTRRLSFRIYNLQFRVQHAQ